MSHFGGNCFIKYFYGFYLLCFLLFESTGNKIFSENPFISIKFSNIYINYFIILKNQFFFLICIPIFRFSDFRVFQTLMCACTRVCFSPTTTDYFKLSILFSNWHSLNFIVAFLLLTLKLIFFPAFLFLGLMHLFSLLFA